MRQQYKVIRVANELDPLTGEVSIEGVEVNVCEQWGEWAALCKTLLAWMFFAISEKTVPK